MAKNGELRIWVNRVIAFVAGGLLIFIILQFTIGNINDDLSSQTKALEEIQYESVRLLEESRLLFGKKEYENATTKLDTLFEKHPTSKEATEGKTLYAEIEKTRKDADDNWAAAEPGIRKEWEKSTMVLWREELNTQYQKNKETLEEEMESKLEREWDRMQSQIRMEWEKKI